MAQDRIPLNILNWYYDSAKSLTQLAAAALVLPITFREKLGLGGPPRGWPLAILIGSWASLLVAAGCGALYQYLAIKNFEVTKRGKDVVHFEWLRPLADEPGVVYGVMLVAFAFGVLFFFLYATAL